MRGQERGPSGNVKRKKSNRQVALGGALGGLHAGPSRDPLDTDSAQYQAVSLHGAGHQELGGDWLSSVG